MLLNVIFKEEILYIYILILNGSQNFQQAHFL